MSILCPYVPDTAETQQPRGEPAKGDGGGLGGFQVLPREAGAQGMIAELEAREGEGERGEVMDLETFRRSRLGE